MPVVKVMSSPKEQAPYGIAGDVGNLIVALEFKKYKNTLKLPRRSTAQRVICCSRLYKTLSLAIAAKEFGTLHCLSLASRARWHGLEFEQYLVHRVSPRNDFEDLISSTVVALKASTTSSQRIDSGFRKIGNPLPTSHAPGNMLYHAS